jgi:acetyl esterase
MEDLARQSGAAMVFVDYALAPGKHYPFQFEQLYAVLDHTARQGHKYNLLTDRIVLAGDSAGGKNRLACSKTCALYTYESAS